MFAVLKSRLYVDEVARPEIKCGKGLTKQSMKKDTDINLILAKYQKTGMVNFVSKVAPEFMETSEVDFQEALNTVIRGNEMFAEMPSSVRKKFDNNPEKFLAFVHDPANLDEMVEMGLAQAPPPTQVVETNPPPTAPEEPPAT